MQLLLLPKVLQRLAWAKESFALDKGGVWIGMLTWTVVCSCGEDLGNMSMELHTAPFKTGGESVEVLQNRHGGLPALFHAHYKGGKLPSSH